MAIPPTPPTRVVGANPVITDLDVHVASASTPEPVALHGWQRLDKDLYLHASQQSAWLYVALANEEELTAETLVVVDIRVGEQPPNPSSGTLWEGRNGGIWLQRSCYSGNINECVTELDILYGIDAVDPRPRWTLMQSPLQLDAPPNVPVARLSLLYGRAKPGPERMALRVKEDGTFKIVQISDTHMVTGVGVCKDAIDAYGNRLPESEADPLTVHFISKILDLEEPDLVVLTGDQLHHDIPDSQSALFKVVAPIIERSIPFAAVFGNHDSEGVYALSRMAQMSLLQNLPLSLCEPGPEQVDGVGNFVLDIHAPSPSELPLATLYFLDSHGQIPSAIHNPDYDPIQQSQIDWFTEISQAHRKDASKRHYLSLAFQHIPVPEFKDGCLEIRSGHRGEPTECPSVNSRFYDALAEAGISALGCGHDHVNDFCALLRRQPQHNGNRSIDHTPWLCYGGASGFGGYCSYGKERYHRRMRVWEMDTDTGTLKTWMRVEYAMDRVDELVLLEEGEVVEK